MMFKYNGRKFGGYLAIHNFQVKYWFYWVVEQREGEKVLAKVWSNA